MQLKPIFGCGVMAAVTLTAALPAIAQSVPASARNACIQRTAEEMVVSTRDVSVASAGPVSAESGATTLFMRNNKTGQTAECRVNTIDNTVLSVTLGDDSAGGNTTGQNPEFWVVTGGRTFLKASPGILAKTATSNVPNGTVLRNLGCQSQTMPTWCQVEFRDDPSVKGWAWSPNLSPYRGGSSRSKPSSPTSAMSAPEVGTPVDRLSDLVGARAGQAESAIQQRGYRFVKSDNSSGDAVYSYWQEIDTQYCVVIRTAEGRYDSIIYNGTAGNCRPR